MPRYNEPLHIVQGVDAIVGSSLAIQDVRQRIASANKWRRPANVLITGEPGTGKELVASALHDESNRRHAPFIPVNCATFAPGLALSQFFGHEKGAFTGADHAQPGCFQLAHQGSLFLDELGELPLECQAVLLRVLDEKAELWPVGATKSICVNVRVIAATNRDLRHAMQQGQFRDDVYDRIAQFSIRLPPLRERKDDIPALVQYFLERLDASQGVRIRVTDAALGCLQAYDWPGNIRQLRSVLESAARESEANVLIPADFVGLLTPPVMTAAPDAVGQWVSKVYAGDCTWSQLTDTFKPGPWRRAILHGIIVGWRSRHGKRPTEAELATLLQTTPSNVGWILHEADLRLTDYR